MQIDLIFIMFALLTILLLVDGTSAAPAPRRPAIQMPDEYLPPNKILFLQNLPESVTKEQLTSLFSQCVPLTRSQLYGV